MIHINDNQILHISLSFDASNCFMIEDINSYAEYTKIVTFTISIWLQSVPLPSKSTYSTQSTLSDYVEYVAENEESATEKDTPMSAYFIAAESFTPSPIISTLDPQDYRILIICTFYSGLALAKTLVLRINFFRRVYLKLFSVDSEL